MSWRGLYGSTIRSAGRNRVIPAVVRLRRVEGGEPMRILHMDDHAGWRDLVQEYLSDHDVTSVGTALEGLRRGEEPTPDLVIVDSEMPGMSGVQAIAALVARGYPPRHILMLSAALDTAAQAQATAL